MRASIKVAEKRKKPNIIAAPPQAAAMERGESLV